MKTKLLIFAFALVAFATQAQTVNGVLVKDIEATHIEIVGTATFMSNKVKITIDFGQMTRFWSMDGKLNKIVGEDGKAIKFNSMIDALNFFTKYGYTFLQAYTVTIKTQNVYHYLLTKSDKQVSWKE